MVNFYFPSPQGRKRERTGTYPGQWYFDSVNRRFYFKTIPDYSVSEDTFNKKFYFHTVEPEEREGFDCAAVIKSIKSAEVQGRVFEPDNPSNIIERDGLRLVNVRERYYDALNERREKKMAA